MLSVVAFGQSTFAKWFLHNLFQRFIREQEQTRARRWRHGIPVDDRWLSPYIAATSAPPSQQSPPNTETTSATANSTGTSSSVVVIACNMLPALSPIHLGYPPRPYCPSPACAILPRSPRHKYGVSRQRRHNHSLPSSLFREILVPLINPHRRTCPQRRRQRPPRRARIMLPCPRHGRQRRKAEPEHPLLLRPRRRRWTRAAMRQGQM
jgi:hypothetical protein